MAKKVKDPRPSWDEYFMEIAQVVAKRSNCTRRHVAAVIVKDRHILSTGYNGTPHGTKNCFDGGCPRCSGHAESGTHLDECLCVHAEQNAISFAAKNGIATQGADVYVTWSPCVHCAKVIVSAGIKKVFYKYTYDRSQEGIFFLAKNGIECRQLTDEDIAAA